MKSKTLIRIFSQIAGSKVTCEFWVNPVNFTLVLAAAVYLFDRAVGQSEWNRTKREMGLAVLPQTLSWT